MTKKNYSWLFLWVIFGVQLVIARPQTGNQPFVVTWLERASESPTGEEANSSSSNVAVSANGRFVAFSSVADKLVEGDTNDYGMLGAIGIDIL